MLSNFFYEVLYRPLFNLLFFIYNNVAFQDLGLSIIALTVLVRVVLYPLFQKSVKYQTVMQKIQPQVKEIQAKYKNDLQKQTENLRELYKENNVNPFSGFFLILLQLPLFIVLYKLFSQTFAAESFSALYPFVNAPSEVNGTLLGLINLHESSIILVVIAAVTQFLQGFYSLPKTPKNTDSAAQNMSKQMVYIGPAITVMILVNLPSAMALYWAVNSVFGVAQQIVMNRKVLENTKPGGKTTLA